MCWRLILEEFGHEVEYIKGESNFVADAISCLEISDNKDILNISELFCYDDKDLTGSAYPIFNQYIAKSQETDDKLNQNLVSHKDYTRDTFYGSNQNHCLLTLSRCSPSWNLNLYIRQPCRYVRSKHMRVLNTCLLILVNESVPSTYLLSNHDQVRSNEVDLQDLI